MKFLKYFKNSLHELFGSKIFHELFSEIFWGKKFRENFTTDIVTSFTSFVVFFIVGSNSTELMALKYMLLGIGVCLAAIAYWLYSPLPDAFPPACSRHVKVVLASSKIIDAIVSTFTVLRTGCKNVT